MGKNGVNEIKRELEKIGLTLGERKRIELICSIKVALEIERLIDILENANFEYGVTK